MAGKYEKTAKDKAFDRERTILQSQIIKLYKDISEKNKAIKELREFVEKQEIIISELCGQIALMEQTANMTEEEKVLLFTKEKRNAELHAMLKSMNIFRSCGLY